MRIFFYIFFCVLTLTPMPSIAEDNETLAIIVGLENPAKQMNKPELALIFWRKKLYWPHGERIHPVNLNTDNVARQQFSKRVLGSVPESQSDYWNGLYFHGISPPHVVKSSEAAIRFVAETHGAIAYVPACTVDDRVKILVWLDADGNLSSSPPSCSD